GNAEIERPRFLQRDRQLVRSGKGRRLMPSTKRRPRSAKRPDAKPARVYNVHPDTLDFRDRMYEPSLAAGRLPPVPLAEWQKLPLPVLDQGSDGACTGFALATVV